MLQQHHLHSVNKRNIWLGWNCWETDCAKTQTTAEVRQTRRKVVKSWIQSCRTSQTGLTGGVFGLPLWTVCSHIAFNEQATKDNSKQQQALVLQTIEITYKTVKSRLKIRSMKTGAKMETDSLSRDSKEVWGLNTLIRPPQALPMMSLMSKISSVKDLINLISLFSMLSQGHCHILISAGFSLNSSSGLLQSPLKNVLPQAVEDILQTKCAEGCKSWLITSSCSEVLSGSVSSCGLLDKYKKSLRDRFKRSTTTHENSQRKLVVQYFLIHKNDPLTHRF